MAPLKISADDEALIDLHDDEVVIDLMNNDGVTSTKGSASSTRTPAAGTPAPPVGQPAVGKAASVPPAAAGKPAEAPAGQAKPDASASGGNATNILSFLHTKNGRTMLVVIVAAIIIGALLVVPLTNSSPTAVITADSTDVKDGEAFSLSGNGSSDQDGDVDHYEWDTPDDYHRISGGGGHSWIFGYFSVKNGPGDLQERTIVLTVTDDQDAEDSASIVMTVIPLEITPAPELIGNYADYDIEGEFVMMNTGPDGLFTIEKGDVIQMDDVVTQIVLNYTGDTQMYVEGPFEVEDGFLKDHTTYRRRSKFAIVLDREKSYAQTRNNGRQEIFGDIAGHSETYIYAPKDRAVKIDLVITNGKLKAGSIVTDEKRITGRVTGYPYIQSENNTFHISELNDGEKLSIRSTGQLTVGSQEINWSVVNVRPVRVKGTGWVPCLEIDITYDRDGDPPTIRYWIADDYAYPLETKYERTSKNDEGTTTTTRNTKKMTDHERGTGELPDIVSNFTDTLTPYWDTYNTSEWLAWGDSVHQVPLVDQKPPRKDDGRQDHHGIYEKNHGPIWQVEDAVEKGRSEDDDFQDYLETHPDAYIILALYNETGPDKVWNMTFGQGGDPDYYNIEVKKNKGVTENGEGLIETEVELKQGLEDIPEVHTFATCVHRIFKMGGMDDYSDIRDELFLEEDNDKFDFEEASIGQNIMSVYAMSLSGANGETAEYSIFAMNVGRNLTVMVDATTGQLMYFVEKEGFLDILMLAELVA